MEIYCLVTSTIDQVIHIHYCQSLYYLCLITIGMYNIFSLSAVSLQLVHASPISSQLVFHYHHHHYSHHSNFISQSEWIKNFLFYTTHILLNCPRSGPFHITPGSEYLQPPFRYNTKRETNDKCLTGTLEYHNCHKITVIWNHILLY